MKKLLLILSAVCGLAGAQSLTIVNGSGHEMSIPDFETQFINCFIPDSQTSKYLDETGYTIPVAKVAKFTLSEAQECSNKSTFVISTDDNVHFSRFSYAPKLDMKNRLGYYLVTKSHYIYPSVNINDQDGLVVNLGNNGN